MPRQSRLIGTLVADLSLDLVSELFLHESAEVDQDASKGQ